MSLEFIHVNHLWDYADEQSFGTQRVEANNALGIRELSSFYIGGTTVYDLDLFSTISL